MRGKPLTDAYTYRLLALGGSTTECLLLDQTEAWPNLLQTLLNSTQNTGQRFWVGNVGKSGHTTHNHILQLERLLEQYPEIDAVLLLTGVNDFIIRLEKDENYQAVFSFDSLNRSEYEKHLKKSFAIYPDWDLEPSGAFYQRTELWRRLMKTIESYFLSSEREDFVLDKVGMAHVRWTENRKRSSSFRTTLPDLSTALTEYAYHIETLIDIAERKGVRPIFMTQPSLWRRDLPEAWESLLWLGGVGEYPWEEYYTVEALEEGMQLYNAVLQEICERRKVECLDLAARLPKDLSVFYDDVHFNENGSRQVAEYLAAYIADTTH